MAAGASGSSAPDFPPVQRGTSASPPGVRHLQLAWRHKFLLLASLLAGAIAGTVYVVVKTPLYQAVATVEVVGFNQSFMGMSQVDPQAGTDATSSSVINIQTQIQILKSRSLLGRVMDRMNLELAPVAAVPPGFFSNLHNALPYLQREPTLLSREALETAAKTVSAKAVGATRLIEIDCMSTSPEVAANFLNTLVAEHTSQVAAARSNLTQRTSQWMDSQLEEAKSRLQEANTKLGDFVQKSGMDFFPEQNTLADSQMKTLQGELSSAQADRIAKQTRWETAKSKPFDSLPDVMGDANLQGLKNQIATLRVQMAQLTNLTAEHPKVQQIQAQITQAEKTLETEKTALLKRLQSDYEAALLQQNHLMGAYNKQTHTVGAQSGKSAQYAMLKRDVDTQQQLYNSLLQQSNQAALIALAPSSSVRVVDAATPNPTPASPDPIRQIPTGALLGGILGYCFLWRREVARSRKMTLLFDTPGVTRAILGVPELGVIPSVQIEYPRRRLLARISSLGSKPSKDTPDPLQEDGHLPRPGSTDWQTDRSSFLSESFRQTLVSLLRNRPRNHTPVYVITSAGPGEGKTTLSANLARAMAEVGHRVLLVDADLRRPHLHTLFGVRDHIGLSDILSAPVPVEILIPGHIQSTEVNNLSVMTHGLTQVETPALLFFSPRVRELVAALQDQFDFVLFDTPPALPFPDARLWGKHSDGVVLVVRAGITSREAATSVCQRLVEDGIPVIGTILNDWAPAEGSKDAYYYYHYDRTAKK